MKIAMKVFLFTLVALLLLVPALPAAADVIVEPRDDFYEDNLEHCTRDPHSYIINSAAGYTYLYKNPKSSTSLEGFSNGESVYIEFLYTDPNDGNVWGCYQDRGWFRMSDLSRIYDSDSFREEFQAEIRPYVEDYSFEASEENPVTLWAYPGGAMKDRVNFPHILENVSGVYNDGAGNTWGYIGYLYGMRDVWICLSDPYSTTVGGYAVEKNKVSLKAEPVEKQNIPEPEGNDNYTVLIATGILVAIVVAFTTILCVVFFKQKKKGDGT